MPSPQQATQDHFKAKGRRIGALAALGCFAGAIGYAGFALLTHQAEKPAVRVEQAVLEAAIARIDAESRDDPAAVLPSPKRPAEAAAGTSGTAKTNTAPAASVSESSAGYAFLTAGIEMARAPMPEGYFGEPEDDGDGLDWLGALGAISALTHQAEAAERDWSFGWVRAAHDAPPDAAKAALEKLGVEVLGASGRLFRTKLPGDPASLQVIAALPEVAGLGAVPKERKVAAGFVEEALAAPAYERTPVFITLMTDDPQGRWRHRLEELGVVVGRFDPDIRAYAAHIANTALDAITSQDFVLALEPIGIVRAVHDTAVPAMGADALRRYNGSPGLFSGISTGAAVPIAVMDTGLNTNHLDISTNRESICGANFVYSWEGHINEADLWVDQNGHGTHVTGTVVGNGYVNPLYAGMAPGVQHIRFAKVLNTTGFGDSDSIARGMDFLAQPSSCAEAGWSDALVKPLLVNMSLAASNRKFEGRGFDERKLDSIVWGHRQLYVVAQSNENIYGFSNYGTAKNSLSVSAIQDDGSLALFSSHGPTADGRLAPQIVATGVSVYSTNGDGARGSYRVENGTSMAAPSVAGVAALLMNRFREYREYPALIRAHLMASAIKPDVWLDGSSWFPADNSNGPGKLQAMYGLGKASARTSVLNRDRADGWISGAATSHMRNDEYAYRDIEVPENASRLDLVMTWDEPPTDTIGQTVLNDLDLWLDREGDCDSAACGERSSTSRKDNVEWIILRNPPPGTYRVKIVPRRIYGTAPRAALAWTLIRGPANPQLRIQANKSNVDGTGPYDLTLTLTANGYVAAGTRLHAACHAEKARACDHLEVRNFSATREDGITQDISTSIDLEAHLGEIAAGERQEVSFQIVDPNALGVPDPYRLYFMATAWNAKPAFASVGVSGGNDQIAPAIIPTPTNDSFADASLLEGTNGTLALNLWLSTSEPGEPIFDPSAPAQTNYLSVPGLPFGSLWYVWTAPANELVRFDVQSEEADTSPWGVKVDVFQGDHIAEIKPVVSKFWGASFFAQRGKTYRIRVSHDEPWGLNRGYSLTMHWSQGPRPPNDDFGEATTLIGVEGTVEGSNQGATLQPEEVVGSLAATTWHRWRAPRDGVWQFIANHNLARILVFTGDAVGTLRLVSGYPSRSSIFSASAGEMYSIAVAASDGFASGRRYRLTWREEYRDAGNDDFVNADEISGASSHLDISLGDEPTVEPGEPAETGSRTLWWTWTAPEAGRYTWRLTDTHNKEIQLTAFAGPPGEERTNLQDLQVVGATSLRIASTEFTFDAATNRRYWFAAGFSANDLGAFNRRSAQAALVWGPTPENDTLADATFLSGASGSASGSNQFATTERGEPTGREGLSSLWWTWEAPAAGWYRFWVEGNTSFTLAAYQEGGDGFSGLDLIVASHFRRQSQDNDLAEILLYAELGARYSVRLGTVPDLGNSPGEAFMLRWDKTAPSARLRYGGRLRLPQLHGDVGYGGLAFDDLGTTLYKQSLAGLYVMERNAMTGALTKVQVIEGGLSEGSSLLWDPRRSQLYGCDRFNRYNWKKFTPLDGNRRELRNGPLPGSENVRGCRGKMFMDPIGEFLFSTGSRGFDVFDFDASGGLRHIDFSGGGFEGEGIVDAAISGSGGNVYALTYTSHLLVYGRDPETGGLRLTTALENLGFANATTMAISNNDRHLFVFNSSGQTALLQFDDNANLKLLETLGGFFPWGASVGWSCHGPSAGRNYIPAADVFCIDSAFSVRHQPQGGDSKQSNELVRTDYISYWESDGFNNHIPRFHPRRLVVSPDGKHVYIGTVSSDILWFERVGSEVVDTTPYLDASDLVVGFPRADKSNPELGALFALRAIVHNRGGVESETRRVHWHRSADATISAEDEQVGTSSLEALLASSNGEVSANLRAPSSSGLYYYGACVEPSSNEANTENNCSAGALFRVGMPNEHGNTPGTATEAVVPSSTAGKLDPQGDQDYFRIVLRQTTTLEVRTSGGTDTKGILYRQDGEVLGRDDDGGNGTNFRIKVNLEAGTYFVKVLGYRIQTTGDYILETSFSNDS